MPRTRRSDIDTSIMARGGTPRMKLLICSALLLLTSALAAEPVLDGMDTTVAPGNDFFEYANGGWSKTTEIPADRSSYGTGAILTLADGLLKEFEG